MTRTEVREQFKKELTCIRYFEKARWGSRIRCAYCNSTHLSIRTKDYRFKCYNCNRTSYVTVGTHLHGSNIKLSRWLDLFAYISESGDSIKIADVKKNVCISHNTATQAFYRIGNMLPPGRKDNIIIADMIKKAGPLTLRKRINASSYTISKCVTKGYPVLHVGVTKEEERFSKIMKKVPSKGLNLYLQLFSSILTKELDIFWYAVENKIKEKHPVIDLKNLKQYIMEAVFEFSYPKDIISFENLVACSMKEFNWQKTTRIKY